MHLQTFVHPRTHVSNGVVGLPTLQANVAQMAGPFKELVMLSKVYGMLLTFCSTGCKECYKFDIKLGIAHPFRIADYCAYCFAKVR